MTIISNNKTSIGSNVLSGNENPVSLRISSDEVIIGEAAFEGSGISTLSIYSNMTMIESSAFSRCGKLKTINIASRNKVNISTSSFYNSNLTLINITYNETLIGTSAFGSCHSLTSVFLSSNSTTIGPHSFSYCSQLKEFDYEGTNAPSCGPNLLKRSSSLTRITVSSDYSSDEFWGKPAIHIPDDLRNNQCYEYNVSNNGTILVWKKPETEKWDGYNKTCVECECENTSGIHCSFCEHENGSDTLCSNEQCIQKDIFLNDKWVVVIDVKPFDVVDFYETETKTILSNLSEISEDDITIATEVDKDGQIVRVVVQVDNETKAKVIADTMNNLDKKSCDRNGANVAKESIKRIVDFCSSDHDRRRDN